MAVVRGGQADDLIGKGGKGGGKASYHFLANDLLSHGIGMAVAHTATTAGKLIRVYRDLRFYRRLISTPVLKDGIVISHEKQTIIHRAAVAADCIARTIATDVPVLLWLQYSDGVLGNDLKTIIEQVASSPKSAKDLHTGSFRVNFIMGRPSAAITFTYPDQAEITDIYVMQSQPMLPDLSPLADHYPMAAAIPRTASLTSYTIEMLADLLRDTWEHQGRFPLTPTSSSSSTNTPPGEDPGPKNDEGDAPWKASPTRTARSAAKQSPNTHNREAKRYSDSAQGYHDAALVTFHCEG